MDPSATRDAYTSGGGRHRQSLLLALGLTSVYLIVEVVGGILTGGLALLADAGHMLTDVAGLVLALFAITYAQRPPTARHTYGYYRTEILAALLNGALLFAVAGYILIEAWRRFQDPPSVQSGPMILIALIGLGVNLVSAWLLHRGSGESLNVRGAYLEVLSDMLGSLGVLVAGAIIFFTGWPYADPLFSVAIGLFIIPRTWRLVSEAVTVLLEGTPARIDLDEVREALTAVPGAADVHDLHVWSLTTGLDAMSGHVVLSGDQESDSVLTALTKLLNDRFAIAHTTIQVEETPCARATTPQLPI